MKVSKQIIQIVEAETPSQLSDNELKKFWKDMQENVFKYSKNVEKNDLGLFYGNSELEFETINTEKNADSEYDIDPEFEKKPKNFISQLELKSVSPREIVSIILNDHSLGRESNEFEDEQAFNYFLKNLKGEKVCFYGETTASGVYKNEDVTELEIKYTGHVKINNFKYDEKDDELVVTGHDIVDLDVE